MSMTKIWITVRDDVRTTNGAVRLIDYSTDGAVIKDVGTTEAGLNFAIAECGI